MRLIKIIKIMRLIKIIKIKKKGGLVSLSVNSSLLLVLGGAGGHGCPELGPDCLSASALASLAGLADRLANAVVVAARLLPEVDVQTALVRYAHHETVLVGSWVP